MDSEAARESERNEKLKYSYLWHNDLVVLYLFSSMTS